MQTHLLREPHWLQWLQKWIVMFHVMFCLDSVLQQQEHQHSNIRYTRLHECKCSWIPLINIVWDSCQCCQVCDAFTTQPAVPQDNHPVLCNAWRLWLLSVTSHNNEKNENRLNGGPDAFESHQHQCWPQPSSEADWSSVGHSGHTDTDVDQAH